MENIAYELFETGMNNIKLKVLDHGYLCADSTWRHERVHSPFNRLYLVECGSGHLFNDHQHITFMPGYAYLIPAHTTYNYLCEDTLKKFYLHFRLEAFSGQDIFSHHTACSQQLCPIEHILEIIKDASLNTLSGALRCKGNIDKLLARFIKLEDEDYANLFQVGNRYKDLFQYLDNCISIQTNLDQMAAVMNLTVSALGKIFKQDTGYTLKGYLNQKIIDHAKEKLILTDLSIKEIAYLYDFLDALYFSRFFKHHVGISPMEYRRNNRINPVRT